MLYLDAVTSVSSSEVKKEVSNSKQQSLVPKTELYVVVVTCYLLLVVLQVRTVPTQTQKSEDTDRRSPEIARQFQYQSNFKSG